MKCPHCQRHFRSKAAHALYERRRAVIDDLTASVAQMRAALPDRTARHREASRMFRMTGEKMGAIL